MVRRSRLIGLLAVLGVAILGFPAAGSALVGQFPIVLTAKGPTPSVLNVGAGGRSPLWINHDQVTHTVTFANGLCALQLAPGDHGECSNDFFASAGQYPYTVDGTVQASVNISLNRRMVTLTAKRHRIEQGARLLLHGVLAYDVIGGSPPTFESAMPVTLLARPDGQHPFRRVAVTARVKTRRSLSSGFPWKLSVRPRRTTTYIVEATSEVDLWQPAMSRPFTVVVRGLRASR